MNIRCLFGQMKCGYPRQYAPELICAIDEYTEADNSARWDEIKAEALKDGYAANFETIREIIIDVPDEAIIKAMRVNTVAGEVKEST